MTKPNRARTLQLRGSRVTRLIGPRGRSLSLVAGAVALMAAGATTLAIPVTARACGGLFCGGPPPDPFAPLPVAQNGENVVFAIAKDPAGGAPHLTGHIQILYTGDAAEFSWVLPVDAAPVLDVGTDQLFTALAGLTQPRFSANTQVVGQCRPSSGGPAFGNEGVPGRGQDAGSQDGGVASAPSVNVISQGAVGPFDTAVIKSDDPTALKEWLTTNGYVVSDKAAEIIDAYVAESKYFVALKLLNGKDVSAIQPIVLKFRGNEACVPLRLTAIAANPDMPVRMWVLGEHRAVPQDFLEMKLDEARIDWLTRGSNYNELVRLAADEAGGNAFVAEYAGPSQIAAAALWSPNRYDVAALRAAMTPPAYVQLLLQMGLVQDTQMLPLLRQFIPMPAAVQAMGVSDRMFYGNLTTYWAQYTITADLPGLTDAIVASIIEPRRVAQEMIDAHPYLTRLNTFISPEEMNQDALFILNPDLPEVSNVHTATFKVMCGDRDYMECTAPIRLELPDGRSTWVRAGSDSSTCQSASSMDLAGLATLPAAEVVWRREATGEGTRVKDNSAAIQAGLELNDSLFARRGCSACGVGGGGGGAGGGLALASLLGALLMRHRRRSAPEKRAALPPSAS